MSRQPTIVGTPVHQTITFGCEPHTISLSFSGFGLGFSPAERSRIPAVSPPDSNRRSSVTNGFSLDVQKTSTPYKPEVLIAGCALCPSKHDAEAWHDVFAGDP